MCVYIPQSISISQSVGQSVSQAVSLSVFLSVCLSVRWLIKIPLSANGHSSRRNKYIGESFANPMFI